MNKKLLALALSGAMCISLLTGCGDTTKSSTASGGSTTTNPTSAPVENKGITYTLGDKINESSISNTLPTENVEITQEMYDKSVVCKGNWQRLAEVFTKASNGEEITIAFIGGSITYGSVANPQEESCYAGLTRTWFEQKFPDTKINYVNAGVGATDSYIGVHRANTDVLAYNPDLVVVEFSVNDTLGLNKETYESLLRKLLSYETNPAVVSLVLCTESSYYQDHQNIAFKLGVPCVSYANVAQENMKNGTWSWEQLGSSDKVHPINGGHATIARLLTNFFEKVIASIPEASFDKYTIPEETVTLDRYENAEIVYADTVSEKASVTDFDKYEQTTVSSNLFNKNAWKTTEGGTISFAVKDATNVGIIFWGTTNGQSGQFEVYVNDELVTTINADFTGQWGSYASYVEVGKFPDNNGLNITIKPAENTTGNTLTILALAIS